MIVRTLYMSNELVLSAFIKAYKYTVYLTNSAWIFYGRPM